MQRYKEQVARSIEQDKEYIRAVNTNTPSAKTKNRILHRVQSGNCSTQSLKRNQIGIITKWPVETAAVWARVRRLNEKKG